MSAEIEMFCAQRIPWDELCEARRYQRAEIRLVERLIREKPERFSDESIKRAVHDIVHVAQDFVANNQDEMSDAS